MIFIEIAELKNKLNLICIEVIESPKTNKLFATSTDNSGKELVFKVEQAIDFKLPCKYMYESPETIMEGCFINVKPTSPPKHSW